MRIRTRFGLLCLLAIMRASAGLSPAAQAQERPSDPLASPGNGVSAHLPSAYEGYSLVAPMNSTSTYLIDMDGRVVNEWKSGYTPALSAYLLENGHLLRPAANRGGFGPGAGGRIQEFDWDGELVWDFALEEEGLSPHHDICPLPNGNVLVIATEAKSKEQAVAAGRRPELVAENLLPDCILEIRKTGRNSGEIVWEWHAWDHLVQDFDKTRPNYGDVSEHPELIDVNFGSRSFAAMMADPEQLARLRTLGYVGGGGPPADGDGAAPQDRRPRDRAERDGADGDRGPRGPGMGGDWMHTNSVAYNADLDQIMLSIHGFNEVWIIDHSTTSDEAASHQGGRCGMGGDLLYRWGNPQAYRSGSNVDQRLFGQHCAHWIAAGLPGAGNMLVFNNGNGRPDGAYSSVDEIVLPVNDDGTYAREEYVAFGPELAAWSFRAQERSHFFSMLISGAQRLPNGNTYICSGNQGMLFEVTPAGDVAWVYKHPGAEGGFPRFDPPRPGQLFPEFVLRMLRASETQASELAALQAEVDEKLSALLTEAQRERRSRPPAPPFAQPGGPRRMQLPRLGEIIPSFLAEQLELTEAQSAEIASLQEHVDSELEKILNDEQRTQIAQFQQGFRGPGGNGPPGFGPPGAPPEGEPRPDRGPRPDGAPRPDGERRPESEPRRARGPRPDGEPRPDRGPRPDAGPRPEGEPRPDGRRPDDDRQPRGPRDGDRRDLQGNPPPDGNGNPFGGRGGGPGGIFRSYRYGTDFPGFDGRDLTPGEKLADTVATPQRPDPADRRGPRPD